MVYKIFIKVCLTIVLLTLSLHSISASKEFDSLNSIPFENASGLILVSASIEGVCGKFIFDTGADQLLINSAISLEACDSDFSTVQGEVKTQKIKISSFRLGQIEIENFQAFATDLSQLESHVGSKILGIIGAKMLDSEIMHINKKDRVIEFLHRKTLKALFSSHNIQIPVIFENDIPIINLSLDGDSYRFILDTGASISFIDKKILDKRNDLFIKTDSSFDLVTASGEQSSHFYYKCNAVNIGNIIFSNVEVSPLDLTEMQELFDVDVSGIISLDSLPFSSLVLDYKNGLLYCSY